MFSQVEQTPTGEFWHWLAEDLPAGTSETYTTTWGERARNSPARIAFEPGAAGWTAGPAPEDRVEALCPPEGILAVSLFGQGERMARVTFPLATFDCSEPSAPLVSTLWVRDGGVHATGGPLFSDLDLVCRLVDPNGATLFRVRHHLRCYAQLQDCWLLDWSATLQATTGPVVLASDPHVEPNAAPGEESTIVVPLVRVGFASSGHAGAPAPTLQSAPGYNGPEEIDGSTTPVLVASYSHRSVAALTGACDLLALPLWKARDDGVLQATPFRGFGQHRLSLGSERTLRLRLCVFTDRRPLDFAVDRFFDLVMPPRIEMISTNTAGNTEGQDTDALG